jgi:hypothetical protein
LVCDWSTGVRWLLLLLGCSGGELEMTGFWAGIAVGAREQLQQGLILGQRRWRRGRGRTGSAVVRMGRCGGAGMSWWLGSPRDGWIEVCELVLCNCSGLWIVNLQEL